MSKTAYNISLKSYVGDYDFDRATVDKELAKNEGKQVNVLIDSIDGSFATGLSISAAFRNHGNIHVDFVGLYASDVTISSYANIPCLESICSMFNYYSVYATPF